MATTAADIQTRIADAAARLFRRYGVRGIRMDDIAIELQMSKRTIYEHVKDKEALVRLAMRRMMAEGHAESVQVFSETSNVVEGMVRVMDMTRERIRQTNPALIKDIRRHYPSVWAEMRRHRDDVQLAGTVTMIEMGIKEGLFRNDIQPDVIAKLLFGQFEVIHDEERFPPRQYDHADLLHTILLNFLRGIATEKGRLEADRLLNNDNH